jgi:hypothetical protein
LSISLSGSVDHRINIQLKWVNSGFVDRENRQPVPVNLPTVEELATMGR